MGQRWWSGFHNGQASRLANSKRMLDSNAGKTLIDTARIQYSPSMKRIVTPAEMQEIDRKTIQEHGIAGEVLMEHAGQAVFDVIAKMYPGFAAMRIVVFCGKGNNGGDGFVIARMFRKAGAMPFVYILGSVQAMRPDSLVPYNKMIAAGIQPEFVDEERFTPETERPDLVIDALLGTGGKGELRGAIYQMIRTINEWRDDGTQVIAVDIPSGLQGDSGKPGNMTVIAHHTVTMGLPKSGLLFGDGKNYTGQLHVADLGFPLELTVGGDAQLVETSDIRERLRPRRHDAHKHSFGKVLLVCGSRGMTGAAVLAARSAMRSGAGLVRVASVPSVTDIVRHTVPEAMTVDLDETSTGSLARSALPSILEQLEWADALGIGSGLTQNEETVALVKDVLAKLAAPAVVDADAILALAGAFEFIQNIRADVVFTPHAGEFAMLSGTVKEKLLADRPTFTKLAAKKLQKTILLKGSPTLVADTSGKIFVNPNGNPGMATAGSGDVLTGMIAALLGQGLKSVEAGFAGAFLHGLAGDLAVRVRSERGLIAGDLIEFIPGAFLSAGVQ